VARGVEEATPIDSPAMCWIDFPIHEIAMLKSVCVARASVPAPAALLAQDVTPTNLPSRCSGVRCMPATATLD
jgi:hypothetical protein